MVKVNLLGYKQFQDILTKAPDKLKKRIGAEIQFAGEHWVELAVKDAPGDTGFLKKYIYKKELTPLSVEVVSASEYSAPMEFGTKGKFTPIPGIDSSEFKGKPEGTWKDFVNNIAKWVRRKGISGTYSVKTKRRLGNKLSQIEEDYALAYVIARSIYLKGVTPHPYFFKQLPIVRRDLFRRIREILNEL